MYQKNEFIKTSEIIPPASLIVGPEDESIDYAVRYTQRFLCVHNGCKTCVTCCSIAQQTHHQMLWITPELRYTLEALEIIRYTINLALEDNTHFFFILNRADTLSLACSNSLLKLVEEPPSGYHFIFLAQKTEEILPTIRSRCIITQLYSNSTHFERHPLMPFFTHPESSDPFLFLKALESTKMSEQECTRFVDTLFNYWTCLYKKNIHQKQTYSVLMLLKTTLNIPPMMGSSKLFLKNLYVNIHYTVSKRA